MSTEPGKQYGLILPKKGSSQDIIQRPSIFDEGSDSADSGPGEGDWKKAYQRETTKSLDKRQTKIQIQKALNQDPSIYQYDEVYDDIKDKVNKATPLKKEEKKQSRYIQSLKRNAERRKLENERRLERQVQKERLEEGEEFKDKETFVTSSYKKKLEEFQKMDEEEKQMDRLEEIGDVSKQKDISGFYRHLYKTTVDVDQQQNKKDEDITKEPEEKMGLVNSKNQTNEHFNPVPDTKKHKRQYRKRTKSGSSREEGEKTSSTSSSSSSTSSNSDSEGEKRSKLLKKTKEDTSKNKEKVQVKKSLSRSQRKENIETSQKSVNDPRESKKGGISVNSSSLKEEIKSESVTDIKISFDGTKPSVNIWLKRTVGTLFDDALQKYLERKSKR